MASMQVKGTGLNFLPDYIIKKHGKDKFDAWLNALPPSSKEIYANRILASSWYPLEAAMTIPLHSVCDMFHGGDIKGPGRSAGIAPISASAASTRSW
jgi:hypothetical protein